MKNRFKHIISFSMILILLVSTLQFSLHKMECLISGNTEISWSDFEACDNKEDNDCSISEQCCCFHEMVFDFNYNTNISEQHKNLTLLTPVKKISTVLLKTVFTKADFTFYTNLPPPSGYELLKVVQVFRL